MTFHIITLFPESLESYVNSSIIGRAVREKRIKIKFYNPRDFVGAKNKSGYKPVDSKPYGGGPGMVLEALPILKAVEKALASATDRSRSARESRALSRRRVKILIFSPGGKQFSNDLARTWTKKFDDIVLISGRYEGIDARVKKILRAEEISVGPFVLTGGELPAMIVLDAMSRQIKGVLGKIESLEDDRIASSEVYTRPEALEYRGKKYRVPKVLISGHHKKIEEWREKRQAKSVDK